MSDPFAPKRVCVTVKIPESKRYAGDNPWLVFEGDPQGVKGMIAESFGLGGTDDLSLADVAVNAQQIATALGNASHGLGATAIASKGGSKKDDPPFEPTNGEPVKQKEDVWSQVAQAQSEQQSAPPKDPILTQIEASESIEDLQQIWAENQESFGENGDYMTAYKTKGKALLGK